MRIIPLDIGRYADVLAVMHHYRSESMSDVLTALGVDDEKWMTTDAHWTEELALSAARKQTAIAFTFSTRYAKMRRRLARQGLGVDVVTGRLKADMSRFHIENEEETVALRENQSTSSPVTAPREQPSFMVAPSAHELTSSPWVRQGQPFVASAPLASAQRSMYDGGSVGAAISTGRASDPSAPTRPKGVASETISLDDIPVQTANVLPFEEPKAHPVETARRSDIENSRSTSEPALVLLTMQQHASLHVDLEMRPDDVPSILRRYGLTQEQHAKLDAQWDAKLAADLEQRRAWEEAIRQYRSWLETTQQQKR